MPSTNLDPTIDWLSNIDLVTFGIQSAPRPISMGDNFILQQEQMAYDVCIASLTSDDNAVKTKYEN